MAAARPSVARLIGDGLARAARRYLDEEPSLEGTSSDPEHVHRARTSIRRIRAILRAGRAVTVPGAVDSVRQELKWLGGALGAVRDADVMARHLSDLGRPDRVGGGVTPAEVSDGISSLVARLASERSGAFEALHVGMSTPRYSGLRADLAGLPAGITFLPSANKSARAVLPALIASEYRRLSRMVRKAGASTEPATLHAIRIQAKKCRYTAELAVDCCGKPAQRLVDVMGDLQDHLGLHHDMVVLTTWLREGADNVDARSFLDRVATSEIDRLAAGWHDVWMRCASPAMVRWLK